MSNSGRSIEGDQEAGLGGQGAGDLGEGPRDDPFDPFRPEREASGVAAIHVEGEELLAVLDYRGLKAVARNWETFTSDAPFRVPIPEEHAFRSVRQLPIETDPPDHRDYRQVVRDPFSRAASDRLAQDVRSIVDDLLDRSLMTDCVEVVRGFALPLQSRALALLLQRPLSEAERWMSWGTDVFKDQGDDGQGHADDLDRYLDEVLDRAVEDPEDDFFGLLARGSFHGRPLSREEMLGFANLVFAGGRDTLINLVVNGLAYLCDHPEALVALHRDPNLARTATEEFLRYYSPLTHIGRVVRHDTDVKGCPVAEGHRVALNFASANRDRTTFDRADECVLDRHPNRHVAFGHGPHTCLGAPLARLVMTTLLTLLPEKVASLSRRDAEPHLEDFGSFQRQVGFHRLEIAFAGRDGAS